MPPNVDPTHSGCPTTAPGTTAIAPARPFASCQKVGTECNNKQYTANTVIDWAITCRSGSARNAACANATSATPATPTGSRREDVIRTPTAMAMTSAKKLPPLTRGGSMSNPTARQTHTNARCNG